LVWQLKFDPGRECETAAAVVVVAVIGGIEAEGTVRGLEFEVSTLVMPLEMNGGASSCTQGPPGVV
jgi:formylmethanofuran dehydrogenase subunit B